MFTRPQTLQLLWLAPHSVTVAALDELEAHPQRTERHRTQAGNRLAAVTGVVLWQQRHAQGCRGQA